MATMLPPNATPLEQHIEASADRLPSPAVVADLSDPYTCPLALLPYLAWARNVLEWDDAWDESRQRAVIAASIPVHNKLGTVGALRQALVALGYSQVKIIERHLNFRNGIVPRDATSNHGSTMPAYHFDVQLNTGVAPTAVDVLDIRRVIDIYKNMRSKLRTLKYMTLHHNAVASRNAVYLRDGGIVNG